MALGQVSSVKRSKVGGLTHKSRANVQVQAVPKGRCLPAESIKVKRPLGEGSYGQVFEGLLDTGNDEDQRVVLKRVKARVAGAQQMGEMEHLLNVYASRVAKGHCADFIGYAEVQPSEATQKLTQGLWLAWRFEGSKTLAYYLRRRDTLKALAVDLDVPESAVLATAMKHICESLQAFHSAGLVHRDVKPFNLILAEDKKRLKLIDLGACADLRSGTNYVPDESILDPAYCPPEQYVLPTDAPHLAQTPLAQAISPMLWALHKPDRFDMWSAGLVMMQLAIPSLRLQSQLSGFTNTLQRNGYDIDAWRASVRLKPWETAALDADDGAGWELAKMLLRPRSIVVEPDGTVKFVSDQRQQRISASDALKHRFMKQAVVQAPTAVPQAVAPPSRGGSGSTAPGGSGSTRPGTGSSTPAAAGTGTGSTSGTGAFMQARQMWQSLGGKLLDLEAQLLQQVSVTEKQSMAVNRLRTEVAAGRLGPDALQKAEKRLDSMQDKLSSLQGAVLSSASRLTGWMFGGTEQRTPLPPPSGVPPVRAGASSAAAESGTTSGGMWKGLSDRLLTMQRRLLKQQSATDIQTFTVKKLRVEVAAGSADEEQLKRAETLLQKMQARLASLQSDYQRATDAAVSAVGSALGSTGGTESSTGGVRAAAATTPAGKSAGSSGAKAGGTGGKAGSSGAKTAPAKAVPIGKGAVEKGRVPVASATEILEGPGAKAKPWWSVFGGKQPAAAAEPAAATAASTSGKAAGTGDRKPAKGAAAASVSSTDSMDDEGANSTNKATAKWVYAGLKLTAFAAKVANDVATSVKADATKLIQDIDREYEARRAARAAEVAFLRLLRAQVGWLTSATSYAEAVEKLGGEVEWMAVPELRRPVVFGGYIDGLKKREEGARKAAVNGFKELFKRAGATATSTYEEVAGLAAAADPAVFGAVSDDSVRREAFAQLLTDLLDAEAAKQAAAQAEDEFMQLLAEVSAPAITANSTWPMVKRQIQKDTRFQPVPEERRRQLLQDYMDALPPAPEPPTPVPEVEEAAPAAVAVADVPDNRTAEAAAQLAVQPATAPPAVQPVVSVAPVLEAAEDSLRAMLQAQARSEPGMQMTLAQIQQLLAEQARLREEYGRMEQKLREMEERMSGAASSRAAANPAAPPAAANGQAAPAANGSNGAAGKPSGRLRGDWGVPADMGVSENMMTSVDYDETGAPTFRFDDPSVDRGEIESVRSR